LLSGISQLGLNLLRAVPARSIGTAHIILNMHIREYRVGLHLVTPSKDQTSGYLPNKIGLGLSVI